LNQSFGPHASLNAAAFSPSGKLAVTAGSDGAVKIWNVDPKAQGHRVVAKIAAACGWDEKLEKPYAVNSAVFGPHVLADSSVHLLTAGDDFKARLWRLRGREQPELLATLSGHTGPIQQAVFSRDGKRIATASKDGTTKLWDASEPENVKELPIKIPPEGTQAPFTCVSFSRDGKRLVTGGEDNIAQIWNLEDMTELPIALKGHAAGLTSVGFSPDGRRVVSGSIDKMAIVWDARSVRFDDTDEAQDARSYENLNRHLLSLNRHDAEVMAVEFSDDGNRILTASRDGTVIVWPTSPIGTE